MKKLIFILFLFGFSVAANGERKNFWEPIYFPFDSLAWSLEIHINTYNASQLSATVEKLYAIAKERNNPLLYHRAVYWEVEEKIKLEDFSQAKNLIDKTLPLIDSIRYPYDLARYKLLKSTLFWQKDDYVEAYKLCYSLAHYFQQIGDNYHSASVNNNMGTVLSEIGNYDAALAYFQKTQDYLKNNENQRLKRYTSLGICNLLFRTGQKAKAIDDLQKQMKESTLYSDTALVINMMLSLCHFFSDNNDSIKKYADQTYNLAKKYQKPDLMNRAMINMGSQFIMNTDLPDSAIRYYSPAYQYGKEQGIINDIVLSSDGLSISYELKQQWDSAYYYMKEHQKYSDILYSEDKMADIKKQLAQDAIAEYEAQVQLAEQKTAFEQKKHGAIMIGGLILSIIVCYILWNSRNNVKKNIRIKELELDYKNRESAINSLIVNEKNQTLRQILSNLDELSHKKILPSKEKKLLESIIQEHLNTDKEWEYIKQHFELVHPDFFVKLKEKAPGLTENDLHLCVYFSIGMTSKQIAQILSVLPKTVNTARYRMKKKIGLMENESLEDFLRGI
jgi:DNA-binding CsgD family transcriptional regulator